MQSFFPGLNQPKVTVVLATYNHEAYVAEAIDSVLMQETGFPFEVVIVEDCSTDRTREIITEYRARYPEIIRLVLAESNQNDNRAWGQAIIQARGQYVAHLDGDDYWTSPYKLQKQADYLDNNPDCVICFHNVKIISENDDRSPVDYNSPDQKAISTTEDLWRQNFIATCSVVLRKGVVTQLPNWYFDMRYGDWPLYIIYSEHGRIGYLRETMGIYRRHDKGAFSSLSPSRQLEENILFYDHMGEVFAPRYSASITGAKIRHGCRLAGAYYAEDNLAAAGKTLARLLGWFPYYLRHVFANTPLDA